LFSDINVSQGSVVGFLVTTLLQIYCKIFHLFHETHLAYPVNAAYRKCKFKNSHIYFVCIMFWMKCMIGALSDAGKHDKHAKSDKEDRKMKNKISQVYSDVIFLF